MTQPYKDALNKTMSAWKNKLKPLPEFKNTSLSTPKPSEEKKK